MKKINLEIGLWENCDRGIGTLRRENTGGIVCRVDLLDDGQAIIIAIRSLVSGKFLPKELTREPNESIEDFCERAVRTCETAMRQIYIF